LDQQLSQLTGFFFKTDLNMNGRNLLPMDIREESKLTLAAETL